MLQNERQEKILDRLRQNGSVKVTVLAKDMGISESTIRRDINELDRQGRLKKVFGGAVALNRDMSPVETDVAQRTLINIREKDIIAEYAASMINDNDFVYIDAGTTTEKMIDYLDKKSVTYVTNGITHAKKLIQRGFDAYVIGGLLRPSTEAVIGAAAIEAVQKYNFTKCFMGTNGIDTESGFTTPDIGEAAVKTAVMKKSYVSFVLADHTKFGLVSPVTFADIEEACVITDRLEGEHYRRYTVIKEVEG